MGIHVVFAGGLDDRLPPGVKLALEANVKRCVSDAVHGYRADAAGGPMEQYRARWDRIALIDGLRQGKVRADSVRRLLEQPRALGGGKREDARTVAARVDAWDKACRTDSVVNLADKMQRADAFGDGNNPALLLDFEYLHSQLLLEKRAPLSYEKMLALGPDQPPVGAKTHRWRRLIEAGQAMIYRGSSADLPQVHASVVDEEFDLIIVVAATETNYFDMLSQDFAGLSLYRQGARIALRAINERLNDIFFNGDTASKLYGLLNYPNSLRRSLSTNFSSGAGEDVASDLNDFVDATLIASSTAMMANRLGVSPRVHRLLSTRAFNSSGSGEVSIRDWFLKGQPAQGIRDIDMIPELYQAGPSNSVDLAVAYNDDPLAAHRVMPQLPTALPTVQLDSLRRQTVFFAITGGVVQPSMESRIGECTAA